jgi:hypothetical protein
MTRKVPLLIVVLLASGFASAMTSRRAIEERHVDELAAMWQLARPTSTVTLRGDQLATAPIEPEAIRVALQEGPIGRRLERHTQRLSISGTPPAWVSADARVVGPFLVIVDTDGASRYGTSATTHHGRTLNLAVFGLSWRVGSWTTGGISCGIRPAG